MDHILFIRSFIGGHSGCLQLLATVNNAAMNVGIQISVHVPASDSFVYIPPEVACLSSLCLCSSFSSSLLTLWRFCRFCPWKTR